VLKSANKELAVTLVAKTSAVDVGAGRLVRTYTYDDVLPGHTWEISPGDTLRIDLQNDLPKLEHHEEHVDLTRPHEWTTTNLHTHGLHVSPSGNADNVFLSVAPGATRQLEIPVPEDHPAGIFWYHPHRHGAVAQQVRAGMAGLIIIRGDIDRVEEVRAANEQILVLQAIEVGDQFQLLDPIPYPSRTEAFYPRDHILYTVNGVLNPRITMHPGEVQRWRILNAAEGKYMSLRLEGHDLHVLAWDGLTLAAPQPTDVLMLSAANRVDLLVKAGRPGLYSLVLTPGSSQRPNIPGMTDYAPEADSGAASQSATPMPAAMTHPAEHSAPQIPGEFVVRPILTVEVTGAGPEMALPTSLPAWDPPILPIARRREVFYTVERDEDREFLSFGVNGDPFDPNREPYRVRLGTAEEWTVVNGVDTRLQDHAHVFHIHTNPFKVTKINGTTLDRPLWRDTFVLTKRTGDSITFESNFKDYTGRLVDHCHVLTHEDLGMMESIEIVPGK
jgi:FtsP/CotA-like multicopper oxidase with cupredoxin domain